nr:MAG: hypothetical protein EDM05_15405 [Leptolyngbya sp. IPPAS B-1204]
MKYFPDLKVAVPPVELIDLSALKPLEPLELSKATPESATSEQSATCHLDANQPDQRWLMVEEFLQATPLEPNSRRLYKRELQRFFQWSDRPLAAMTPALLAAYCTWLETTPAPRTGKPLARNSINVAITALKRFFAWLGTTHPRHCATNPTTEIKWLKAEVTPPSPLSTAALACLWGTLPSLGITQYRDTLLVHLLCQGLRVSEIVALNLANWDGAQLWLPATKNQLAKNQLAKNQPLRSMVLHQASRVALEHYLDWRRQHLPESLQPDSPLVISLHVAHSGKRLSYIGIYQAIERLGQLASQRYRTIVASSAHPSPNDEQTQQQLANLHPDQLRHMHRTL